MPSLDRIEKFIGETSRPLSILVTAVGAAWATVVVARKVENGTDGALLMGAIFAGVAALYIGKAVEVFKTDKNASNVKIAEATGVNPTEPK